VVHGDARLRAGVEDLFGAEGVRYFFVDSHLFRGARSEGVIGPGGFGKVGWDQATWDTTRAWRSVLEPHGISSDGGPPRMVALARHPEVSEQVWSGQVGYPGDPRYLEFHKKHGHDGLRYWRVTHPKADLGAKSPYAPGEVESATRTHAQHFLATVRAVLVQHAEATGRHGIVTAPFDAELFGHWWHEGPRFLGEFFRALHHDPAVAPTTVGAFLDAHPPDKVVTLPEGSWGEGGDHRVWFNEELRWTWEAAYRAEDRFLAAVDSLPWRARVDVAEPLRAAARELLLLQASDWQFVIHSRGAVDYGFRRFCEHLGRFDRACTIAERRARGVHDGPVQTAELTDIAVHDDVFRDLDLAWWDA
jgi:1,4-alpha-glucan branching enzyme